LACPTAANPKTFAYFSALAKPITIKLIPSFSILCYDIFAHYILLLFIANHRLHNFCPATLSQNIAVAYIRQRA